MKIEKIKTYYKILPAKHRVVSLQETVMTLKLTASIIVVASESVKEQIEELKSWDG